MTAVKFKQADVTRAINAAKKAGLEVESVQISPEGKIKVQVAVDEKAARPMGGWD